MTNLTPNKQELPQKFPQKLSLITSFTRSQIAALIATAVDFTTLVALVEGLGIWYVSATAFGAAMGGVTNFLLGRHWSFEASDGHAPSQVVKYTMISGSSLILNSLGVYLFTDFGGFQYPVSKLITAIAVGVFFNFPLQRGFVFR